MIEVQHAPSDGILYVYAPMCGTCAVARRMLEVVEAVRPDVAVHSANGNFIPVFMERERVMSVPALLRLEEGRVVDRIYAFQSVENVLLFCQK